MIIIVIWGSYYAVCALLRNPTAAYRPEHDKPETAQQSINSGHNKPESVQQIISSEHNKPETAQPRLNSKRREHGQRRKASRAMDGAGRAATDGEQRLSAADRVT